MSLDPAFHVLQYVAMGTTVSIRLPEKDAAELQQFAAKTGRSKSEIVRDALRKNSKSKDPRRKVLQRLTGSLSGPGDLSTREGFSR